MTECTGLQLYCAELYWAEMGCTGPSLAVLDCAGLYWAVVVCTWLYLAVLGSIGL